MNLKTLFGCIFILTINTAYGLECSIDAVRMMSDKQAFIDVYIRVDGSTVLFEQAAGSDETEAHVLVGISISKNDTLVYSDRYLLYSGLQSIPVDMLDKQRIGLNNGIYHLQIQVSDHRDSTNTYFYQQKINLQDPLPFSDGLILTKFEKTDKNQVMEHNGYEMEPLSYMLVNESHCKLTLYQEVYHQSTENYLQLEIVKDTNAAVFNGLFEQNLRLVKKITSNTTQAFAVPIDLCGLSSGKYHVITSIITKSKLVLHRDSFAIAVDMPKVDLASIKDYNSTVTNSFVAAMDSNAVNYALRAIVAITPQHMMSTVNYVIRDCQLPAQKYYLLKHWQNTYPGAEEVAYRKYMKIVDVVDADYKSNVGRGFESDRGYIYLKYGKPSKFISIIDEPNTVPYEIWYYNYLEATGQTNVRFLFYDRLQANDYELLHSTCYAERRNPAWEVQLYKFNQDEKIGPTLTATEVQPNWGRRAKKLFNDF